MPKLDAHGIIAAAEVAAYVPIAVSTIYLVFYYAFRRDAGWLFLFFFSAARLANGALILAGELTHPTKISLFLAAYTLQAAALGFLLLSTIGFLGLAGQSTYSEIPRVSAIFRVVGFLTLAGTGISAAGGGISVPGTNDHIGLVLRRVGAGIFAFVYVVLFLAHLGCWSYHYQMRSYRRKLLGGLTIALPFLGVRVAYAVLAAWSSADLFGFYLSKNPALAKLNPVTANFIPYLVLSVIMEYVVTVLYLLFSTVLARRHGHI